VNTSKGSGSDGVGRKLGIWTGCQAHGGTARASGPAIAEVVNTSKGSGSDGVGRKLGIWTGCQAHGGTARASGPAISRGNSLEVEKPGGQRSLVRG